jgi:hypothetical protein
MEKVVRPEDSVAASGPAEAAPVPAAPSLAPAAAHKFGDGFSAAFVAKKAEEQAALGKWNLNGDSRNQGLVHLLDYSHARPARNLSSGRVGKTNLTAADQRLMASTDKAPRTGAELANGRLARDADPARGITARGAEAGLSSGRAGMRDLVANEALVPHLSAAGRPLHREASDTERAAWDARQGEISGFTLELDQAKLDLSNQQKAVVARVANPKDRKAALDADPEVVRLRAEVARLEGAIETRRVANEDETTYGIGREESKAGRMDAMGIAKGDEILEGTRRVEAAFDSAAGPVTVKAPDPARPVMGRQRHVTPATLDAPEKVTWDDEAPLPADQLQSTGSASATADGMTVHKWGVGSGGHAPTADDLRFSTVIPKGT